MVTAKLTSIKRRIALLKESAAEMDELSGLDRVTILPTAPAIASTGVEDSALAKVRPLKVPTDAPRFLAGSVPHLFLDDLQSKVSAFIGQDAFEEECEQYLLYLTDVSHIHTSVKDTLAATTKDPALTRWEWCEAVFLRHALSEHERMMELNKLLASGLLSQETYQQFAICVARDCRIYGVKDDNEIVLASLSNSLSPDTLNLILFSHWMYSHDLDAKISSVHTFTEYMKRLIGPHSNPPSNGPYTPFGTASCTSSGPERSRNRNSAHHDPRVRHDPPSASHDEAPLEHRCTTVDKPYECAQCGPNSNHITMHCKRCTNCRKIGHLAAVCRSPPFSDTRGSDYQHGMSSLPILHPLKTPQHSLSVVAPTHKSITFLSTAQVPTLPADEKLTYECTIYDPTLALLELDPVLALPAALEHIRLNDNDVHDMPTAFTNKTTNMPTLAPLESNSCTTVANIIPALDALDLGSPDPKRWKNHLGKAARKRLRTCLLAAIPSNCSFPSIYECNIL